MSTKQESRRTISPVAASSPDAGGGMVRGPSVFVAGRDGDGLLSRRTELVLRELDSLPTLPAVATRLIQLGSQDDVEVREIVRLIEVDPTLTAKLLSLCRRAATRTRHPITTVEMAVVMLGLEAVRSLVLSVQVFEWGQNTKRRTRPGSGRGGAKRAGAGGTGGTGGPNGSDSFDRVGFWQHSIAVACCADLIAREHADLDLHPEEAFVCGLVHDLGKLALDLVLPKAYGRVIELSEARGGNIADFERPIVGLDHHSAGDRLAERWGLPGVLREVMARHSLAYDEMPESPHRGTIAVVGLADAICRRLGLGWSGNHAPVSAERERELAERAGLSWSRVEGVIPRVYESASARCRDLGLGEEPSQRLLVESILRANARLGRLNQELAEANAALEDAQHQLAETRAMARLGEMSAGAAHEMNNPLAVISGRAQTLLKRCETDGDRGALQAIVDASGRLSGLIQRLNRVASPPKPAYGAVDLKTVLERVVVRAKSRASVGAGGPTTLLGVKVTLAEGLASARLDGELFADAMLEIVVNALESTPKSGVEVRAFCRTEDDALVIEVSDDGRGMSEHAAAHATDPFFSEKPAGRQTGLGLALAHRLLGVHGATLEIRSRVGRGTTVRVCLANWRWSAHARAA